jgi:hypothetical protein
MSGVRSAIGREFGRISVSEVMPLSTRDSKFNLTGSRATSRSVDSIKGYLGVGV